jgi:PAS domain S-box-containing protein
MIVYDLESLDFLAANRAAVDQYGFTRDELFRLHLPDLAVPGDPHLAHFLATRFEPRAEIEHVGRRQQRRKDGSVLDVDMTSMEFVFEGGKARLLLCRDLTAENLAQGEQERLQESLRRSESMAAMGGLVAGVAHEVRNPLFSISATVDAFEHEFGQRPEFAEYSTLLRSQVVRLTQLMRDLLDYGKPSLLRRTPTRLSDVVRRAVRSCAGLARERQVRVEEGGPADLPPLEIEAARMEQAVENLLANAIQHAPAGSVVRVGACLDAAAGEPRARCMVEDEGPGVPAEDRDRLFEPFFSRRKGGTGLGLPIVQRVAEAHGGTVGVENRPEGGARFTLLLPVTAPDLERSALA